MTHRSTMYRRVRRGIAWLNEHIPGWQGKIDVDHLDMSLGSYGDEDECGCIGAQLDYAKYPEHEGTFDEFLTDHGLSTHDATKLGLLDTDAEIDEYNALTAIWQRAIGTDS